MDDVLPTYESVTQTTPWELIAPYLAPNDLYSASLVCRKWQSVFTPQLWGSPASHYGGGNDTVYTALTRFMRALPLTRESVRSMTHTLHLPPAHAEFYEGPHDDWLSDCLQLLPRLQSLIVAGLSFFDYAALVSLQRLRTQGNASSSAPRFRVRLLDASGCMNPSSAGISEALAQFPDIVYLDVSRTPAAKDEIVFNGLKSLGNLRVLKMAGLGLKDTDISKISPAIGKRVRSLDVSDNHLHDKSITQLRYHCIKDITLTANATQPSQTLAEDGHESDQENIFGPVDLDRHIRTKLTQGFIGDLAAEKTRDAGITELYISRNKLSVNGVAALLRTGQVQSLDVGMTREPSDHKIEERMSMPHLLGRYAAQRLKYLRIGYNLVTKDASINTIEPARATVEGLEIDQPRRYDDHEQDNISSNASPRQGDDQDATTNNTTHNSSDHANSDAEDLRERLTQRQSQEPTLHPGMLPKLHTLVLTDVPPKTNNKDLVHRLIQFIKDCASEVAIAKLQAKHTYILAPGRSRPVAEREYAQSLFALRRIVFEEASSKAQATLSSTEDPDSEVLWKEAEHDFSFFGDEKPARVVAKKKNTQCSAAVGPTLDVFGEIAQFRGERKEAYEKKKRETGEIDPIVEGYWPGDVIRKRS